MKRCVETVLLVINRDDDDGRTVEHLLPQPSLEDYSPSHRVRPASAATLLQLLPRKENNVGRARRGEGAKGEGGREGGRKMEKRKRIVGG